MDRSDSPRLPGDEFPDVPPPKQPRNPAWSKSMETKGVLGPQVRSLLRSDPSLSATAGSKVGREDSVSVMENAEKS